MRNKYYSNKNGFTLIEIVAAIIIIGLIFISIFSLLINTKKVTSASDQLIDATYIAQQHMEEIYNLTSTNTYNEIINHLINNKNATTIHNDPALNTIKLNVPHTNANVAIHISVKKSNSSVNTVFLDKNSALYNVNIEVFDTGTSKIVMENIYQIQH